MRVAVNGTRLWFDVDGPALVPDAGRFYRGDSSVTPEEWAPCLRLFGPWVIGGDERARTVVNRDVSPVGLELMRRFDVRDEPASAARPSSAWASSTR